MPDVIVNKKPRLKFEPYKNQNFLFFISEINIRNTLLPFFTSLGVKKFSFMKNKEELMYEIGENAREQRKKRYCICIMTYHHENVGNPAYIASLLQSIKQLIIKPDALLPFLILANSEKSLEIQFGKTPEIRALTIRAAAKYGLKGIVIGNLDDSKTANMFIEKVIEIVEDDELAKMSPLERHMSKLVNRAYAYLNKIAGSEEEKEENINKAISLFEEVLEQSRDNCEALLGMAIACASSSNPRKIREASELFGRLKNVEEDMEKVYEGHAGACYKMAELVKDEKTQHKWLLKGVNSLNSLVEWQMNEYEAIKKVQYEFNDPEFFRQMSNKYSAMATPLAEIGGKHTATAVSYYIKGIKMDPKVSSNYKVVPLMEDDAKKRADFMEIVKICASARENLAGKEIDFLISEAEAYFNAGNQSAATKLFNSINQYVSKEQIESWAKDKKDGITPDRNKADKIASFITFLNHRAIYFRRIGNHDKSLEDLGLALSLDMERRYFDIYFNIAKAIISALDKNTRCDYSRKNALNYLFTSITITFNINLVTYETLLKTIKDDSILKPFIEDIRYFLNNSHYSIPVFFKPKPTEGESKNH